MSNPLKIYWHATKRILKYLAGTIEFGLEFKPSIKLSINDFRDANWDSCLNTKRSTSIMCVFLGTNPTLWSVKKQATISRSST